MGFEILYTFILSPIYLVFNISGQLLAKTIDLAGIILNLFLAALFLFMDITSLRDVLTFTIAFGILLLYHLVRIGLLIKSILTDTHKSK